MFLVQNEVERKRKHDFWSNGMFGRNSSKWFEKSRTRLDDFDLEPYRNAETFNFSHPSPFSVHTRGVLEFLLKIIDFIQPKKKCTHSTLLQINRTLSTLVDQISCLFETHFIKFISGPFSISCGKPHPKAVLWQIRMLEYFSGAKFTKQKKNNKHQRYLQTFWLCFRYFWIKNSPRWNFLPKIACVTG